MRQGILADADHGNPMVRGWPELDANASWHFMTASVCTGMARHGWGWPAHHNRDTFFQRSSVLLARCPRPCVLDSAILQMFLNPLQKKVNAQKQTTLDNINRTNWRAPVPATTCKTFLATNKQTYLLKCFRQSYSHFISTDLKKPLAGADKKKQQWAEFCFVGLFVWGVSWFIASSNSLQILLRRSALSKFSFSPTY